jgi:hypothetical protein
MVVMHVYCLQAREFHLGIPGTQAVCRGYSKEDVRKCTLTKLKELASPERRRGGEPEEPNLIRTRRDWR